MQPARIPIIAPLLELKLTLFTKKTKKQKKRLYPTVKTETRFIFEAKISHLAGSGLTMGLRLRLRLPALAGPTYGQLSTN